MKWGVVTCAFISSTREAETGEGGRIAIHCHPGLVNQSPTEPHKGILALETKLGILLLIKHMQGPEFDP